MERPEVKLDTTPKRLSVSLAKDRFGKPTTTFSSNTPEIYARWQGQRLRQGANVKAVWIAENIGEEFPQDYKVDEASAVATTPTGRGAFTLARPEDGWMPGDYRVEFYVDNVLKRDADNRAVRPKSKDNLRHVFVESKTRRRLIITEKAYFT